MTTDNNESSALSDVYREISLAARESAEPPPDELRRSVMSEILSQNVQIENLRQSDVPLRIAFDDSETDPRPSLKLRILARYMPFAACIAVALLAWGIAGGVFNFSPQGDEAFYAMNEMSANIMSEETAAAADTDTGGGAQLYDTYIAADGARVSTDAAPAPADAPGTGMYDADSQQVEVRITVDDAEGLNVSYMRVSGEMAVQIMEEAGQYIIVDVRTAEEFAAGHISNAIAMPLADLRQAAQTELPDTDAVIFVYCAAGIRSAIAAETLAAMGYTHVFDMGAMDNWPLEIER